MRHLALVGNTVRLFAEFRTFEGNLADPTDITLIIYDTNTNYEYTGSQIVRQSLGVYYKDFTIPSGRGWLKYTWSGALEGSTALNQGVIERVSA